MLEQVATLLEAQHASPYRVGAFRRGAATLRASDREAADILATEGLAGLDALPGIGRSLASVIAELVETGHLGLLHRLEGRVGVEALLATVPGIGPDTAHRIHDALGVETLEELELAAHDGRLEALRGFGPRRVRAVRDLLAARLDRSSRRGARRVHDGGAGDGPTPSVSTLLAADEEYRAGVEIGALRRIAPRRFNPTGEAWLPVLHTERDGWHLTALFSNTARAHELHATRDWVVLYAERDGHESRATVVTETHGPLAGTRVVRGRGAECAELAPSVGGAGAD